MQVDYVAARQDIADLKSKFCDCELIDEVLQIMSKLSKPGIVKRKEFDLNQFLSEVAKLDFSKYRPFEVAALFGAIGESFKDGIMVADHGSLSPRRDHTPKPTNNQTYV